MTVDEVTNNTPKESRSSRRRRTREAAKEQQTAAQTRDKDRPTPSQRENPKQGGNFVTRFFRGIADYFSSTNAELRKVTWPSRQDALRLSGIVLAVTVVFSIALGLLDFFYGELFRLGISTPLIFVGFFVVLILVIAGVTFTARQRG